MRRRMLAICAAVVVTSGCYHITVVTGARESSTRITKPFQMSFVSGLVPPPEIQADQEGCTDGVAKVETWRSFVNVLVGALSSSLVTPISVTVTCAASMPVPDAATPSENGEPSPPEPESGAAEGHEARGTGTGG
ncbi:MAG: hypothetical protein IH876_09570 [Gemmatimonadetes bacterium]|nr:hypothetical protein [Gemmatimonadota bacterium]